MARGFSGVQKAAILVMQVGKERAAPILRSMREQEVAEIMAEVERQAASLKRQVSKARKYRALSEETAAAIKGMKAWLTNEFEHSGLRTSDRVFERLLALVHDQD